MFVTVNGVRHDFEKRPTFYELAKAYEGEERAYLAYENGRLRELQHHASDGGDITFVDARNTVGYETLRRTALMLFQAALVKVCGGEEKRAILHFTMGSAFFLTVEDVICDSAFTEALTAEMQAMKERAIPIVKRSVPTREAMRLFHDRGMYDKEKLFRTRIASRVNVYSLDGYEDYFYGFMAYDTSYVGAFSLIPYEGGILLNLPKREDLSVLPELHPSAKLFAAQIEGENWAEQQGIGTVGDLNARIIRGEITSTILTAEALQESRISDIAEQIAARKDVKFVMIAGPSSSGKTTFSQRLCIQLSAQGLKPHYLGVDNYFLDRDAIPLGPDGKKDFESITSVDVDAFGKDMMTLLSGGEINVPVFDFIEGKRVLSGDILSLKDDDILVVEGIHCLNDQLSYMLPSESKFRIYLSALTQLNIDEHNRIPSADGRLIRRIVRDYRTRGYGAAQTIAMWESVRKGEEQNIFPYQDSADVMLNSALPYEIAALKTYVQPLLFQVPEDHPSYIEAKRLLKFLDYFIGIPSEDVPKNSILREFIGGGGFRTS